MRVLEIMGSLHRGGAETMIMNYYRAFDKGLCQMDFVIHARFPDDYCPEAEQMGAKIIELHRPGKIGAYKYIKELENAIKKNGPYAAVHIHTNHQAFLAVIAAKKAGIKKILVHSHNTVFPKGTVLVNRLIMDIIPVSRVSCGEAAGKAFFGVHRFQIINNAIKADRFIDGTRLNCVEIKKSNFGDKKVVGHIGRFNVQKNHDFIVSLAQEVKKRNLNTVFALYGEGEREQEIKNLVREKNLQNQVLFMGVTSDTVTAYQMFDVFILPSRWEGFPVTLVESQLSGVMSLASANVSKECDLKANLIEFLPLNVEIWANELEKSLKESKSTGVKRVLPEIAREFDINEQWKVLYKLYTY